MRLIIHNIKYEATHRWDRFLLWVAYHLPHRIVMWCVIRVINNACRGEHVNQTVDTLLAADALERWHTK